MNRLRLSKTRNPVFLNFGFFELISFLYEKDVIVVQKRYFSYFFKKANLCGHFWDKL